MRTGLIGNHIGSHAACQQLGKYFRCITEQPHRNRTVTRAGGFDDLQGLIEFGRHLIDITGLQTFANSLRITLDRQHRPPRHGGGQRLRATHATKSTGKNPFSSQTAAKMLFTNRDKCLVSTLHDALTADVYPRAGRHLAIHHQPFLIELVEMLPARPVGDEIGICNQHPWRLGMCLEDANRLARLHQQCFIRLEVGKHLANSIETLPIPGGSS